MIQQPTLVFCRFPLVCDNLTTNSWRNKYFNVRIIPTTSHRIHILFFFLLYFSPSPLPSFMKFIYNLFQDGSRNRSVGIPMSYGLKPGVQFPAGTRNFSLLHSVQTSSGGSSSLQRVPKVLFPGACRPGSQADYSPISSATVKNGGASLPLPSSYSWSGA
jgi:hypothetical protein